MIGRAEAPGPMLRRGPRPLLLHLMLGMLRSSGWPREWPSSSGDWASSSALAEAAAGFAAKLRDAADEAVPPAPGDAALVAGIAAYRRHPWRREMAEPPCLWAEGGSRLLDYGGAGAATLFVPSLVNRAYVLDLMPEHSMLRWLAGHGMRPLLLDWGWPGEAERRFTLTDYVAGRLERALAAAAGLVGAPVVLAGYCMGGTLVVAAAERRPELVRALALLAAPWDFHAGDATRASLAARCLPLLEPAMALWGTLPVDWLQVLFAMLDPFGVGEKYRAFGRQDQNGERARLFVALEDWLNDGVPLAAPVARECLGGWYGENRPALGTWTVAGLAVEPRRLRMPVLVVAPGRDRIVPGESARVLATLIAGAKLLEPRAGHVGMVAGAAAETVLWRTLAEWVKGIAG